MAWTATKVSEYPAGNSRVQHWTLVADSATLELSTGLKTLVAVHGTPQTASTAAIKYKINVLSAGTSQGGNVAITGAASGDNLYLMVIGN